MSVQDLTVQADGKVVIAGEFTTFNGISRSRIARLNADGALDASFNVGNGANSTVNSVAVQPNGKIFIGGFFTFFNGSPSLRLARLNTNGSLDTSFESRLQTTASIRKVLQQADGKMLVGGNFNLYAGVARSSLARLTETVPSASVATPTGQSIVVSTSGAAINFGEVTTAGDTVVTAISANQLQPLPPGYTLPAGTPIYDITTTAVVSGGITVTLQVPNVADATACSRLRILHFTNNVWDDSNNGTPVYDSATGICTVSQTVTNLSSLAAERLVELLQSGGNSSIFAVAQINVSNYSVSGQVSYGNTPAGQAAKNVSGVNLSAGSLSATSDGNGVYQLTGLSNIGSHTVTPSKSGDVNGINSTDAVRIQQYLVGSVAFSPNQRAAADTSNNGSINSTDALRIQQYLVQAQTSHIIGQWKFTPASKNYSSLNANLSAEDYAAVLMGEVTGNWTPPASGTNAPLAEEDETVEFIAPGKNNEPAQFEKKRRKHAAESVSAAAATVTVALPTDATAGNGTTVTIPIDVSQLPALTDANRVETYNFNVRFDPNVLSNPTAVATGTISGAAFGSLIFNSPQPGVFSVSYTNPNGITGQGALLNLQFTVVGAANQQTDLTFVGTNISPAPFEFNDGDPQAIINTGRFTVLGTTAAAAAVGGRVTTRSGRGLSNVTITMTDINGSVRTARTTAFGYYRFNDVAAGETYTFTAHGKRIKFSQPTRLLTILGDTDNINFVEAGDRK